MIWDGELYSEEELPQIWTNPYQSNIDRYKSYPGIPECEHPINVYGRIVPCGHCVLCQARRKREWINRNVCESKLYKQSCFATLTFRDENLQNAIYPTVQKFLKRLRKVYGKFRYFGCFEKGEKTGRPHFHILFYGFYPSVVKYKGVVRKTVNECLADIWQQGFVKVDKLCDQTIAYVCGYIQKKMDRNECKLSGISWRDHIKYSKYSYYYQYKDTYFFMSKGIGYGYIFPRIRSIVQKGFYVLHGFKKGIGKWIRDKLKRNNDFLSKTLLWDLDGQYEDKESCEFLPSYVIDFALKHPDKIQSWYDADDIYFAYCDFRKSMNLQKILRLSRINS